MKDGFVLTKYRVLTGLPLSLTIGLVSDLHEQDAGHVLALLRQAGPDMIMVAGDTFERRDRCGRYRKKKPLHEWLLCGLLFVLDGLFGLVRGRAAHDTEHAYRFLREAGQIAPVFLSVGNHEEALLPEDLSVIRESGATLLDNADCVIRINGVSVRVGGLSPDADLRWLKEFCGMDGYRILLCHHPEYYDEYLRGQRLGLVLSGHAHGGQIRIRDHGIYAPGQGLLPKYTKGLYNGTLVVTAGCSNTASVPRWGNPCEVVAVRVEQEKRSEKLEK